MEFGGVMNFDGLVGSSSNNGGNVFSSPLIFCDSEHNREKGVIAGSGHLNHERPDAGSEEQHQWRGLKMARSEPTMLTAATKAAPFLLGSNSNSLFLDGEQMLSFSSSKADAMLIPSNGSSFPYCHLPPPPPPSSSSSSLPYARNAGFGSGYSNTNMHGALAGSRVLFTRSQWMELEQQALIYKYIEAKITIPLSLLISLTKTIITSFPHLSFRSNNLGWGSFQLGLSGNVDSEPGRCRRTDGKKWRCSRDSVADQKYCERHMNRGRHRSRKLVEGDTGQATKPMLPIAPIPPASSIYGGNSFNTPPTAAQQQMRSLQQNFLDPSPSQYNRTLVSKYNTKDPLLGSSGFSSSSSFPNQEVTLSPLRLSHELNPIHMGLGVGGALSLNEESQQQASWIPISWEDSMGGPLGEALANANGTPKDQRKNCSPSALNLLTDGWDSSPRLQSSPTDVLQKSTFGSLSSSTGSSPRTENHGARDSTSGQRSNLLGSTFVNSLTIPLL